MKQLYYFITLNLLLPLGHSKYMLHAIPFFSNPVFVVLKSTAIG
jgi:hypothetical protein